MKLKIIAQMEGCFRSANPGIEVKSRHACADEFLNERQHWQEYHPVESKDGGLIVMVDSILNTDDELIFCTKLYL